MNTTDAIRFLEHEAREERRRQLPPDAFTLLLPAMLRVLRVPRMNPAEAETFRARLKVELKERETIPNGR